MRKNSKSDRVSICIKLAINGSSSHTAKSWLELLVCQPWNINRYDTNSNINIIKTVWNANEKVEDRQMSGLIHDLLSLSETNNDPEIL